MCLEPSPSYISLALFWVGFTVGEQRPGLRSVLSFFPQQKDFILYNLTLIFKSPELCFFCLLGLIAFTALSSERCLLGKLIARIVLFSRRSLGIEGSRAELTRSGSGECPGSARLQLPCKGTERAREPSQLRDTNSVVLPFIGTRIPFSAVISPHLPKFTFKACKALWHHRFLELSCPVLVLWFSLQTITGTGQGAGIY